MRRGCSTYLRLWGVCAAPGSPARQQAHQGPLVCGRSQLQVLQHRLGLLLRQLLCSHGRLISDSVLACLRMSDPCSAAHSSRPISSRPLSR